MNKQSQFNEVIIISKINKIGMVHLEGLKKYTKKNNPKRCYFITSVKPHENVFKSAEKIENLEIIVSAEFEKEKKEIANKYHDAKLILIDSYQLAGRDGMLDGA